MLADMQMLLKQASSDSKAHNLVMLLYKGMLQLPQWSTRRQPSDGEREAERS